MDLFSLYMSLRGGGNSGISDEQIEALMEAIGNKQDTLESGINIKTINNQSLLGEGNISTIQESVLKNKVASFYGDSITEVNNKYTKGYHQWVKELLDLSSYNNYGVGGYTVADVYNKINSISDNSDIIFVMCGVNDQTFNVPLGQFGDTTTDTTYGSYDKLCSCLRAKYPTIPVILITPHYQTLYPHSGGITSYEIAKAMKEVAEKYSLIVYDNFVESEIYPTNLSYWTSDNCHWNDMAHENVGKNLAKFVMNNISYIGSKVSLSSITASYSNSNTVYITDSLDSLKPYITVTGTYSDNSTSVLNNYTLSGTLQEGSNTITISAYGKTTTITVTAEIPPATLSNITATFTQDDNVIYPATPLDNLKKYLVVTANYSDNTSVNVLDYTLTGTLSAGASVITATYNDKDDDFTVNVTAITNAVTGISISGSDTTIKEGVTTSLTATITPNDATDQNVIWSANNENVSLVSNGLQCTVAGVHKGTSIITVTTEDGNYTDTYTITIESKLDWIGKKVTINNTHNNWDCFYISALVAAPATFADGQEVELRLTFSSKNLKSSLDGATPIQWTNNLQVGDGYSMGAGSNLNKQLTWSGNTAIRKVRTSGSKQASYFKLAIAPYIETNSSSSSYPSWFVLEDVTMTYNGEPLTILAVGPTYADETVTVEDIT